MSSVDKRTPSWWNGLTACFAPSQLQLQPHAAQTASGAVEPRLQAATSSPADDQNSRSDQELQLSLAQLQAWDSMSSSPSPRQEDRSNEPIWVTMHLDGPSMSWDKSVDRARGKAADKLVHMSSGFGSSTISTDASTQQASTTQGGFLSQDSQACAAPAAMLHTNESAGANVQPERRSPEDGKAEAGQLPEEEDDSFNGAHETPVIRALPKRRFISTAGHALMLPSAAWRPASLGESLSCVHESRPSSLMSLMRLPLANGISAPLSTTDSASPRTPDSRNHDSADLSGYFASSASSNSGMRLHLQPSTSRPKLCRTASVRLSDSLKQLHCIPDDCSSEEQQQQHLAMCGAAAGISMASDRQPLVECL